MTVTPLCPGSQASVGHFVRQGLECLATRHELLLASIHAHAHVSKIHGRTANLGKELAFLLPDVVVDALSEHLYFCIEEVFRGLHFLELTDQTAEGIPAIYANDNRGHWRSDFKLVVRDSLEDPSAGARITRHLAPAEEDYFILKPKHSAFFATPLELLLDHLRAHRLLVTGLTSDQCIAATVADARMRDFDVVVPSDCVATQTPSRNQRALRALRDAFKTATPSARGLRLRGG